MWRFPRNGIILGFRFAHCQRSFSNYNAKTVYKPVFANRESFCSFRPQPILQNEISSLVASDSPSINVGKKFATMVILVDFAPDGEEQAGTWVILTHRAAKMRKHANEISVPGGAIEQNESLELAALREIEEEIGLGREYIDVWGKLPSIILRNSGGETTPFVASLIGNFSPASLESKLIPQQDEVQSVFLVSLAELLAKIRFTSFRLGASLHDGLPFYYKLPVFVVENVIPLTPFIREEHTTKRRKIWGITAITLQQALQCIFPQ